MVNIRSEIWYFIALIIISVILVLDLFIHFGRPATMDGLTHITTITQFAAALQSGDFPVIWLNNFANYGMPIGIIAHQLPSYLGGLLTLLTQDPLLAFNILTFFGVLGSSVTMYIFLRLYISPLYAFLGSFLFNFAPYRIINIYIRGAIPETFSAIFLPLIMIVLYLWIKKENNTAFFILILLLALLILTHPMMFVIYAFIFIPYFFFLLLTQDSKKNVLVYFSRHGALFGIAVLFSFGLAAYYLIPLLYEVKYLYYGQESSHFAPNQYLSINNFVNPFWYYFSDNDIFTRGHFIKTGVIESVSVLVGVIFVAYTHFKKKPEKKTTLLEITVLLSLVILFFTTRYADVFYTHITLLGNIQFPWRMLSAFIFLPPIIIALLLFKIQKPIYVFAIISIMALVRFPELYGKNYAVYPEQSYSFTTKNLHSTSMNTIWTGQTEEYPIKHEKGEIIGGEGKIISAHVGNSQRTYEISAETPVHIVDYTFYFPGWNVYIDGQQSPIQFQDPNYRGVITYDVPAGEHIVEVKFEDTKVRMLSKLLTVGAIILFVVLFLFRKRMRRFIIFSN